MRHFRLQPMSGQSWPFGSNCWEAEPYHAKGAKGRAQMEVSPTEGLPGHTRSVFSTGAPCSRNSAKWGEKAQSKEEERREEQR